MVWENKYQQIGIDLRFYRIEKECQFVFLRIEGSIGEEKYGDNKWDWGHEDIERGIFDGLSE